MIGMFLLLVVVAWLALVVWLSKVISRRAPVKWRATVAILIFAVLLPLPIVDEIVGGRQFKKLCNEHGSITVDRAKAIGRVVYLADVPDVELTDAWVRVVLKPWIFLDASTQQPILKFESLMADGGRFVSFLRLSQGTVPLIFHGNCQPKETEDLRKLFSELGLTQVQRASIAKKAEK